jgi:diguanylate cyclase (GGDEF)-like protein/PAS domain S-box-containing protein
MIRTTIRELDLRYWIPLLSLAVFIAALLIWMALERDRERDRALDQALADWQRNLTQLQLLLDTSPGMAGNDQAADRLLRAFDDAPGLRYLAAVDAAGIIVHAHRDGLRGRPATELPGFDPQALAPQAGADVPGRMAVEADGHLRAYQLAASGAAPAARLLLYLDLDTAALIGPQQRRVLQATGAFALLVFTGMLGGVLFIRRYVNRPLEAITGSVLAYRPGQPLAPIPVAGSGPLSRLARAFENGAGALNRGIAELQSRESRLERILESIADGVVITDREGRIERLNPVAEHLTGWPRAEARGRGIDAVFAPFDNRTRQPLPNPVSRALESNSVVALANHAAIRSRAGRLHQIADTAAPIRTADGAVEGAVLVFHDVSEAYRLREEQRIAAVAFETGAPQLIADREGRVIRVNQACLDLGGYSREEMLGFRLLGDVFIGQDSPGLGEFLAGRSDTDTWRGPTWWRTRDGRTVDLWVTDTIIRDSQGEIANYVISAIDTTELIRTASTLAETRDNYRRLIESLNDGVAIIQEQRFADCNRRLAQFLGRSRDDILNRRVEELSLPNQPDGAASKAKARALFEEVLRHGESRTDWTLARADGSPIVLEATLSRILWQGSPALLAVARDVTERRQLEAERQRLLAALGRSEEMMRLASAAYGIAAWEMDADAGALTWAADAELALGMERSALPASHAEALRLLHPEDREVFDAAVRAAWEQTTSFRVEFRTTIPGRERHWFRSQGECRRDPSGSLRLYGATADISEYRWAQEDIEQLAFHDPLTHLANRRLLLDRLQQALRRARRSGQWGAVLFIDLDRFKLLNDSLGHSAGDALLRQVGRRCSDVVRDADTVARLGGDEFVILATELGGDPDSAARHATRIATKLREQLSAAYPVGGHDYHLSASIGIALLPRDGDTAEELLRHADVAMYQVKRHGRDGIIFYQPSQLSHASSRLAMERDLRKAVEGDQCCSTTSPRSTPRAG